MNHSIQMVGRDDEREWLTQLIHSARAGEGRICFVSGESGCGKTTLVEAQIKERANDLPSCTLRCFPEDARPYGLVSNLLKAGLGITKPGRKTIANVKAVLQMMSPTDTETDKDPPDPGSISRLAVDALWETLGEECAILFFDDLQWADESSLELIPLLASEIQERSLLLIATCRDEELAGDHPARRVRTRLRRFPHTSEISLTPFSAGEAAELAERVLGGKPAAALLEELFARTNGLPLFVEEFCRSLKTGGWLETRRGQIELTVQGGVPVPESIRDAVSLQCQTLSEAASRALEIAAVLGMEFDLNHLVQMDVAEAVPDELFERQLVVETRRGIGAFRHAVTRDSILEEIPWSRRRRLHGQVGDLLKRQGDRRHIRAIAEHYRDAGRSSEAREAFLESARMACGVHAYRDASRAFEQALQLWPKGESELDRLACMERLASCAQTCGFAKESVRGWREVLESELIRDDPGRRAAAWRHLASALELSGSTQLAIEARESACDAFVEAGLHANAAAEALGLADIHIYQCRFVEGTHQAERALDLARKGGDLNLESKSLSSIGLSLAMQGKKAAARRRIETGLELAIKHNLKEAVGTAYTQLAYVHGYQGDYAGQQASFGTAINFCKREGLKENEIACLGCMTYANFRLGDWKRTTEIAREILAEHPTDPLATTGLALVFAMRGQIKQARRALNHAEDGARQSGIKPLEFIIHPTLAFVDHLADATPEAVTRFRQFLKMWESSEDHFDSLFGLSLASTFFSEQRMANDLNACAAAVQKILSLNRNPESLGSLSHVLGEVALTEGRFADAANHFMQSRTQFERIKVRYDVARSDYKAGQALLKAGATEKAIEHLRRAHVVAKALGARPLQDALCKLLKSVDASAEEPRNAEAPGRATSEGLTRRQLEVAALVAKGMTNKDVAEKLHLSPRTIDMHVRHLLDRLDCSTRSEAVRRLCDLGLVD